MSLSIQDKFTGYVFRNEDDPLVKSLRFLNGVMFEFDDDTDKLFDRYSDGVRKHPSLKAFVSMLLKSSIVHRRKTLLGLSSSQLIQVRELADPVAELIRLGALSVKVEEEVSLIVDRCRDEGLSWEIIGSALDIQRQTAEQRYGISSARS